MRGPCPIFLAAAAVAALSSGAAVLGCRTSTTQDPEPAPSAALAPAAPPPSAALAPPAPPSSAPASPVEPPREDDTRTATLAEQREALYRRMAAELDLSEASVAEVRSIMEPSPRMGQGN